MKQLIQAAEQAWYACPHQTCLIRDCPNEQNIAHQTCEQKKKNVLRFWSNIWWPSNFITRSNSTKQYVQTVKCLVTKQCLMVFGGQTFIVRPGPKIHFFLSVLTCQKSTGVVHYSVTVACLLCCIWEQTICRYQIKKFEMRRCPLFKFMRRSNRLLWRCCTINQSFDTTELSTSFPGLFPLKLGEAGKGTKSLNFCRWTSIKAGVNMNLSEILVRLKRGWKGKKGLWNTTRQLLCIYQFLIPNSNLKQHQIFKISFFHKFY